MLNKQLRDVTDNTDIQQVGKVNNELLRIVDSCISKKLDIVCVLSKFNNKVSSVVTVNKAIINKFNAVELVNIISET